MKVEQIYTGCLAEAAYYIESNGEAAIVDPLRETKPYLELLQRDGAKLKYILETHFHADFVSGHLDLAKATGATIVYGPNAKPNYDVLVAQDEQELKLGDVTIKVLHTPGHTMESSTFLLKDESGKDHSIFTGDTLFIGDVGRPDLAVKTDLSREDLAAHLFDSLRDKILPLADEVIVYPGHGAGSACGKNLSKETIDTLGNQKATNYALRDMSKEEFVKELTDGLFPPPQYFPKNAVINKMGYEQSYDEVMQKGLKPRSAAEVSAEMANGAVLIDTRDGAEYAKGFVPGSFNIGLDGMFAVWVGTLIEDLNTPILLLTAEGDEEEIVTRLSRVGYDNPIGYLSGGMNAWKEAGMQAGTIDSISAVEFAQRVAHTKQPMNVLDVRRPSEYLSEHVIDAENLPLDLIYTQLDKVNAEDSYYLYCKGGYRSMIAASILKQKGINNLVNIEGGFTAIAETSTPVTEYVCPSTL